MWSMKVKKKRRKEREGGPVGTQKQAEYNMFYKILIVDIYIVCMWIQWKVFYQYDFRLCVEKYIAVVS